MAAAAAIFQELRTRSHKPTVKAEDGLQAAHEAAATAAALSSYLSNHSQIRSYANQELANVQIVEASDWLTEELASFDSVQTLDVMKVTASFPKPPGLPSGDESPDDVSTSDMWGRHTTAGSFISKSQADFSGSGSSSSDGEREEEGLPAQYFMSSLSTLPFKQYDEALKPYDLLQSPTTVSSPLLEAMAAAGPGPGFPLVHLTPTSAPPKPTKLFCPWCGGKRLESFMFCPTCGGSLS